MSEKSSFLPRGSFPLRKFQPFCVIAMACRRTRRYFTVDEALDKVLDDFENELFGLNVRGSESEDDDDSVYGDDRPVTISSDVDDDGEHDDHFLLRFGLLKQKL